MFYLLHLVAICTFCMGICRNMLSNLSYKFPKSITQSANNKIIHVSLRDQSKYWNTKVVTIELLLLSHFVILFFTFLNFLFVTKGVRFNFVYLIMHDNYVYLVRHNMYINFPIKKEWLVMKK